MIFYIFLNLEMIDYRKDFFKLNNGWCMEVNWCFVIGSNGYLYLYISGV